MSFAIVTDTSANIPTPLAKKLDITVIPFSYFIDGQERTCLDTEAFDGKAYYDAIRGGTLVTTSQVTPQRYIEWFSPILEKGEDILFVGLSSGVSGSYQSAVMARIQLASKYPDRDIQLVDSLGASLGEGLLAIKAAYLRDGGKSLKDTFYEISDIRDRTCQIFTVDSLEHLRRTGRCSNITAVIGTLLHIKPLLKGDETGHIVSFKKVKGRSSAIEALARLFKEHSINAENQIIGISHGDCAKDAEMLKQLICQHCTPKEIITVCHEPVTGAHVGPGMLALFFEGGDKVRGI
ncbi:MAG: DegV family protein [Clostridia bacterium]|nr:DegV family protein [Clostridia bacterium]